MCGPPSLEAPLFQSGERKKKWDAGRRGRGGGCVFLVFFWGQTHPAALTRWKKTVRERLVHRAECQLPGWPQLGQTGGVSRCSEGSGEVEGTCCPCGSSRDAGAVGNPSLGCCSLAVPGTSAAAPAGAVSGGISAPVGSRSWHVWVGKGEDPGAASRERLPLHRATGSSHPHQAAGLGTLQPVGFTGGYRDGGYPPAWGGVPHRWRACACATALPPGCTGMQPSRRVPSGSPQAPQLSGGFGGFGQE